MITKSDWQVVHARLLAERRQQLGEPPTVEEMLAYANGELSSQDEERVRALLVSYPELLRALTADFRDDDVTEGDPDFLPDAVVSRQWDAFQKRIPVPRQDRDAAASGRVLQFWRASAAIAAALAVAFGALLWRAQSKLDDPRAAAEIILMPEQYRGGGKLPTVLPADAESTLLSATLLDDREFPQYRIEIASAAEGRVIWSSPVSRNESDTVTVLLPRKSLASGNYRATVFGIEGVRAEPLAAYTFRVP